MRSIFQPAAHVPNSEARWYATCSTVYQIRLRKSGGNGADTRRSERGRESFSGIGDPRTPARSQPLGRPCLDAPLASPWVGMAEEREPSCFAKTRASHIIWSVVSRSTLHVDECESYYYNLVSDSPRAYVVAHSADDERQPQPFLVSMSFDEAHAYLEGEDEIYAVDVPGRALPMDRGLRDRQLLPREKEEAQVERLDGGRVRGQSLMSEDKASAESRMAISLDRANPFSAVFTDERQRHAWPNASRPGSSRRPLRTRPPFQSVASSTAEAATIDERTDADMPPLESLSADSDFTGFLSPKVSESLRRAALRKLFHGDDIQRDRRTRRLRRGFHDLRGPWRHHHGRYASPDRTRGEEKGRGGSSRHFRRQDETTTATWRRSRLESNEWQRTTEASSQNAQRQRPAPQLNHQTRRPKDPMHGPDHSLDDSRNTRARSAALAAAETLSVQPDRRGALPVTRTRAHHRR